MAEQTAYNARETAAAVLAEELRQLNKYIQKENPTRRLLDTKLKKVEEAKDELMGAHYNYGQKAKKELNSDELTEWLNPKLDAACDTIDDVTLMIDVIDTTENTEQAHIEKTAQEKAKTEKRAIDLKIAHLQIKNDEEVVKERLADMMTLVEDEDRNEVADADTAETLLKEVETALDDQIKSWNSMKSMDIEQGDIDAVFKGETEIKKLVAEKRSKALAFITKIKPKTVIPESSPQSSSDSSTETQLMKVERMGCPTFSGDSRQYARFKMDFEDIVVPTYRNEKQRIFQLKNKCLEGEAKKLVENITTIILKFGIDWM